MPPVSLTAARDAVLLHFTTAWDAQTPPVPLLLYRDVKEDLPLSTLSWARITMQHKVGSPATLGGIGGRRFRHEGVVTVQVFTPFGGGQTQNDLLTQVAIDAFEGDETSPDGVWFRNVRLNEIGQSGSWLQTNVLVDFTYDRIK